MSEERTRTGDGQAALNEVVSAVEGVVALHAPRPIPTTRQGWLEGPTVHVRSDHVAVAVGISVDAGRSAHAVATRVRERVGAWAVQAYPDLPVRITVRVVSLAPAWG